MVRPSRCRRLLKQEGLLRISNLSIRQWYRLLVDQCVLNTIDGNDQPIKLLNRCERDHPEIMWDTVWSLAAIRGLKSVDSSFLFCLLHSLLPTQERLFRIFGNKVASSYCTLCSEAAQCSTVHALIFLLYNNGVGQWLLSKLSIVVSQITGTQITKLNFQLETISNDAFPAVWCTAKTLSLVWKSRTSRKPTSIIKVRSKLEADVMLLRKSRFAMYAPRIDELIKE